jgi:putative aldouronate transport system substrate-binding protein
MKKLLVLMLIALVLPAAVVLAAGQEEEQAATTEVAVNPPGEFPIVDDPITVDALIVPHSMVEDLRTNEFTLWLEEKTNIQLDMDIAPDSTEAQTRMTLLFASGDYPSVLIDVNPAPSQQALYGNQGIFVPLQDYVDDWMPNVQKMFRDYPSIRPTITMPDGSIYGLPAVNDCYHCSMAQKAWVYEDFLEALDLELPTTTDEFKEMLIAFRDEDPNGNGENDEIPYAGATTGWHTNLEGYLMSAFIYSNAGRQERLYVDENGTVQASFAQPEWRDGLRWINELYDEGLIAPETFTQDRNQLRRLGGNDTVILAAAAGGFPLQFLPSDERLYDYVAIPPLEGPDGFRSAYYDPDPIARDGNAIMTDKSTNREAIARWFDHFYEIETVLRSTHGREGQEWRWAEAGEMGINQEQAIWHKLYEGYGDVQNIAWAEGGPKYRSSEFRLGQTASRNPMEVFLFEETRDKYREFAPDLGRIFPKVVYTEEQSNEIADLETALVRTVETMFARFVIGDASVETDWDSYIAQLENIGLERYLEIQQAAYDASAFAD